MRVFLLFRNYFDSANNWETLLGVFASEFSAILEKEKREINTDNEGLSFFIQEWEVEGKKDKEIT